MVSGGWVLRLGLEIGPLGEDWGKGHDESLKGPVQHSRGFQGKVCASQRGKRSLLWGPSNSVGLQTARHCLHECQRWDGLGSVVPEGAAGWLPPKHVPEIGQSAMADPAPEVGMTSTTASTKLSAGKSHCPRLCYLALPRDSRPGASFPGEQTTPWGCTNFLQVSAATGFPCTSQL